MPHQKSVALLIETSNAYARGLLAGIASYIHEHNHWSIHLPEQERGAAPPNWLKTWKGDGVIARVENRLIASVVEKLEIPVVDVSAARELPIPCIETNDEEIARLAFEHFRERGFRNYAFCGESRFQWSKARQRSFESLVHDSGQRCFTYSAAEGDDANVDRDRVTRWLMSLPRPVAIFACYDIKAQQVLDICRQQGLRVPQDVALLGADNDELLCMLSTPPLSSIIPAAHRTGREAAAMLDAMMRGEQITPEVRLVDPIGVATRKSTDILATDDSDIARAIQFITDHVWEGINVQDVLGAVPLSRRALESRFKDVVGRSPYQEITRRRIERVRQLLSETDLTLSQISKRVGFLNQEYMSVAFRRETGSPPAAYRRRFREQNGGKTA